MIRSCLRKRPDTLKYLRVRGDDADILPAGASYYAKYLRVRGDDIQSVD